MKQSEDDFSVNKDANYFRPQAAGAGLSGAGGGGGGNAAIVGTKIF
jgi:hypothetical protein